MIIIDSAIGTIFLLALLLWIRGVWRQTKSDLVASAVVFSASLAAYAFLYRYAAFPGLPWLTTALGAICSAVILGIRRGPGTMYKARAVQTTVVACVSVVLFFGEEKLNSSSNSLLVIAPYRKAGTWVFDDPLTGLKAEPFVSGIPQLIDRLVADAGVPAAAQGFRLIFSPQAFPGHQAKVVWRRQESGGNWYYSEQYDIEGWLCPALFKYFKRAPKEIYVRAEPQ